MIESDAIKLAISGGVMILTAIFVLRSGRTHPTAKPSPAEHLPQRSDPPKGSTEPVVVPSGRPRILTGEPAAPEQRKPVPRRALRLIAGITTLAIVGAVGLIVVVRALIEMFQQIGG
ncbi:MAG: hypothetical protein WEB06_02735 [Actinomycetota bacterium]